ncbi:bicaudal D-related protein homolog [Eurytemora carolleeae]|nr:bicaudal D-related protein homolog [Eurytemora carolleeae]|eukprot:XP_023327311.1 bicaudal D-related protein homolog [Eurytemora affinis]
MQVNSQLMEAVQQKVSLSQQLDQWQQDVQELLMENMNKKMAAGRKSGADSDTGSNQNQPERKKSSKILAFLKLGPP